jgi:hypothetical protein
VIKRDGRRLSGAVHPLTAAREFMEDTMSNTTNNPATIYATGAVSRNPATDALIATYPYQTPAEVEATLSANAAAFLLCAFRWVLSRP